MQEELKDIVLYQRRIGKTPIDGRLVSMQERRRLKKVLDSRCKCCIILL